MCLGERIMSQSASTQHFQSINYCRRTSLGKSVRTPLGQGWFPVLAAKWTSCAEHQNQKGENRSSHFNLWRRKANPRRVLPLVLSSDTNIWCICTKWSKCGTTMTIDFAERVCGRSFIHEMRGTRLLFSRSLRKLSKFFFCFSNERSSRVIFCATFYSSSGKNTFDCSPHKHSSIFQYIQLSVTSCI